VRLRLIETPTTAIRLIRYLVALRVEAILPHFFAGSTIGKMERLGPKPRQENDVKSISSGHSSGALSPRQAVSDEHLA